MPKVIHNSGDYWQNGLTKYRLKPRPIRCWQSFLPWSKGSKDTELITCKSCINKILWYYDDAVNNITFRLSWYDDMIKLNGNLNK